MTDKTNGKKVVDTLGYTPEQYKLFTKNAWIVLLAFLTAVLQFSTADD